MRNYQTFQEAKIENPELKIYYSMIARCGKDAVFGTYDSLIRFTDSFHECKPADYLPSLEWFYSNGYSLECGDLISTRDGNVIEISEKYMPMITGLYYVLRAAALNEANFITESPDEKEALDMIDTTPKQVDSLAKGDVVEWKNGDHLEYIDGDGEWSDFLGRYISFDKYAGLHVIYASDGNIYHAEPEQIRKPESQEQKAERNNLSIARELAFVYCKSTGDKPSDEIVERMASFVSMIKNIKESK